VLRRGAHSLAILADNKVYRIKDILAQRGLDWRADSMTILCERRYRDTLLRQTLVHTGLLDGAPLKQLSAAALEAAVRSRPEGRPGHALKLGRFGPSNITLGVPRALFNEFVSHLRAMHEAERCDTAAADELVVVMRLGDEAPKTARGWMMMADQYLSSRAGRHARVSKAVICAVLHYDADPQQNGVRYNSHSEHKDAKAFQLVDELSSYLHSRHGLTTRVRSNPDVDRDICFYVFSKHVVGVSKKHQLGPEANHTKGIDPGPGRPGLFSLAHRIRLELDPLTTRQTRRIATW
jgi:hypothetical protein